MVLKLIFFIILLSFATINFKTNGKHKLLRICGIAFGILTLLFLFLSTNVGLISIPVHVKTTNETASGLNIYFISFYESQKSVVKQDEKLSPGETSNASIEIEGVLDLWLVATDKNGEIRQIMKREEGEFDFQFQVVGKGTETPSDKEMVIKLIKRFRLERIGTWLLVLTSVISILTLAINGRKKTTANVLSRSIT